MFLSLITGVVCLGLSPRSVIEIPEHGSGRIDRLHQLIHECGSSIHDLSRVNSPPRFNMPFELGLAQALQNSNPGHHIIVLERKQYRLQQTLSDYNGRDPIIHNGSREKLLAAILNIFEVDNPPEPRRATKMLRILIAATRTIKRTFHQDLITTPGVYKQVVATATQLAVDEGLISIS
jgi:hypothetical protein